MTAAPSPEILDITQAISRWDELLARVEAGGTFIIAVDGVPKGKLQPVSGQSTAPEYSLSDSGLA